MNSYTIGLSALNASQRALELIGQNLANASTPGYHRQNVTLAPRVLGNSFGSGVEVQNLVRIRDDLLERSLTVNTYRSGQVSTELDAMRQVESVLSPGQGTVSDLTEKLFNQLQELEARPDDTSQRRVVLGTAASLAGGINRLGAEVGRVREGIRDRVDEGVAKVNSLSEQLADYNKRIQIVESTGQTANELRDQRDMALNDLAGLIDVRVIDQPYGVINVLGASAPLVIGTTSTKLEVGSNTDGTLFVKSAGTNPPLTLSGGSLAGRINVHNSLTTDYEPRLEAFTQQLVAGLDHIQATGLGLNGPKTASLGVRAVNSATAPLATAGTEFPVQSGALFISVTNQSTGQRTLQQVNLDPATQSLNDFAAALTAATGGNVQASVASGNRLQLQAQAGYAYDFAGRIPSTPPTVAMNGTSAPTVSGIYSGAATGNYSFQVVGNGTVGVTAGLQLQVRDVANTVIGTLNVGQGYTPGTALDAGNGVTVKLAAGTTNNGTFSTPVVNDPDTTGVLTALGVDTLFSGSTAATVQVRPALVADPGQLAASRDGQAADGSNLARMGALRDRQLLGNGTENFQQALASIVGDVGSTVRNASDRLTALDNLGQNLATQQQGVSGVDPNEEVAKMLQFQREFQMSAKFMTAVNSIMDDLLAVVR